MRRLLIVTLLLATAALGARGIPYAAPEFMMSIFDQFSTNYLNAEAAGRGNTGVALEGGVNSVLHNPASMRLNGVRLYVEVFIKPSTDEMNSKPFENNRGDIYTTQSYNSATPFGMFGVGASIMENLHCALLFTAPQSLEYDSFMREIQTDEILSFKPSYSHTQLVAAVSHQYGEFSFGFNLINDFYSLDDYRSYWTVARQNVSETGMRFQPGVRWHHGPFEIGASYVTPCDVDFNLDYGENYTVTIPSVLTAGAAYSIGRARFIGEFEQQACSEQSSDFDDRMRLKFGAELASGAYTARIGMMQVNGVYEGEVAFPEKPEGISSANTLYWPVVDNPMTPDVYEGADYLMIDENDQLFFTCGLGYKHKYGDIDFGVLADVQGDAPMVQLFSSFSVDLATLKSSLKRR